MKPESKMRQRVREALRGLDPISIENSVHPGTPDLNFVEGMLELKWAAAWPKRAETPLRLPHFTPQQRVWLVRRHRAGGNVFLLLQVGNEWILFDGETAATIVGRAPRQQLYANCLTTWEPLDDEQLRMRLTT